ncbi:MAG: ABC transporter permease, partial [Acidobacteriaceae bacterium]|nr:ABC transporter permease [Acidobacteriaceae bacterium]
LSIGATTAMFSLIYAVLIHPYPYAGASRMVNPRLKDLTPGAGQHRSIVEDWFSLTGPQYRQFRKANAVEDVLGFTGDDEELTGEELPEDVGVVYVTSNAAHFFGVAPVLGRQIMPFDAPDGHPVQPVAVLSYKFWQRHYNRDRGVIGRKVEIKNKPYTIIGVMPPRFTFGGARDLFVPLEVSNNPDRIFLPYIKLKPGVSYSAANAEFQALLEQFAKETPRHFPKIFRVNVQELIGPVVDTMGRTLAVLFAAVVLLLLLGCANCSILLLARGTARQHELSVRAALGASRARLASQLLIESMVLAVAGSAAGTVLAYRLAHLPLQWLPNAFPTESAIEINLPVLLFSIGVAILTVAVFGLFPAFRLSRPDLIRPLQSKTRQTSASSKIKHAHQSLIAGQIAITLLLLSAATAATAGFLRLVHAELGFDPHNVLAVGVPLHRNAYMTWQQRAAYFDRLQHSVSSIPGVSAVAVATSGRPPSGEPTFNVEVSGKQAVSDQHAHIALVSDNFFSVLRIPLIGGRIWSDAEQTRAAHLALVNRAFAHFYWPNENPIGQRVRIPEMKPMPPFALANAGSDDWLMIIGVVGDIANDGLMTAPKPTIYLPFTDLMPGWTELLVRTQIDPHALLHAVRVGIQTAQPDQQISKESRTLDEWIAEEPEWGREHLVSLLFGGFGIIALVIAATGLYSVVSYGVSQRTSEFGIRMAVGAQRTDVLWLVFASTAWSVGAGLFAGALLAFTSQRFLGHWIEGSVANPFIVLLAVLLLMTTAAIACLVPARRASGVDPIVALRHE